MKKFLIRTAIFLAFTILVMQFLGWLMDRHFSTYNNKQLDHPIVWQWQQKNNQYDFAIIGSSRAYNILDVLTIEKETGKQGINLASGGANMASNYLLLQQFYKHGNRCKTLVLNIDYSALHSDSSYKYPFADYAFIPLFSEPEVSAIFWDQIPRWKYFLWKAAPYLKYAEFNKHYPFVASLSRLDFKYQNATLDSTRGSALLYDTTYKHFPEVLEEINYSNRPHEMDMKYLQKILDFCDEHDIELYTYTAPYLAEFYVQSGIVQFTPTLDSLAQAHQYHYDDFSIVNLSASRDNFRDYTHLNGAGARIFSLQLAKRLIDLKYFE